MYVVRADQEEPVGGIGIRNVVNQDNLTFRRDSITGNLYILVEARAFPEADPQGFTGAGIVVANYVGGQDVRVNGNHTVTASFVLASGQVRLNTNQALDATPDLSEHGGSNASITLSNYGTINYRYFPADRVVITSTEVDIGDNAINPERISARFYDGVNTAGVDLPNPILGYFGKTGRFVPVVNS